MAALNFRGDYQYAYDAFGNVERHDGITLNAYRYTGEYFDVALGHIYLRDRWLNPNNGRFGSIDRFSGAPKKPATLNKYAYTGNDPINAVDPSGMMTLGEIGESLDVQGALMGIARDQAMGFLQNQIFGNDDEVYGKPSLYEMMLATILKSAIGSASDGTVATASQLLL